MTATEEAGRRCNGVLPRCPHVAMVLHPPYACGRPVGTSRGAMLESRQLPDSGLLPKNVEGIELSHNFGPVAIYH